MSVRDALISKIWLKQQFDQLDKADALILKRLDELEKQNGLVLAGIKKLQDSISNPNPNVIPALEKVIKEVSARAISIDKKVPDQTNRKL